MFTFIRDLVSENTDVSSLRVMSFISLIAGILVAGYGMYRAFNLTELSLLASVFVGAAFGGKVVQKKVEMGGSKDERPNNASQG